MKQPTSCGSLSAELNDQIDEIGKRSEVISDMASASGLSESSVEAILDGDASELTRDALDGFSYALESNVGDLVAAANQDGCKY